MFTLAAHYFVGEFRLFTIAFLLAIAIPASADPTPCSGTLLKGDHRGEDIKVTGTCTVEGDGGTLQTPALYVYHNINVVNGGKLIFMDNPIDFHVESVVVENMGSLSAGSTVAPIGTNGGRLRIFLWGKAADPGVLCQTDVRCGVPENLWKSNTSLAMRQVKKAGTCKPASDYMVTLPGDDCFYQYDIIENQDKTAGINAYFAHKVIALSFGGTLRLYGKKGAIYDNPTDNNPANTGISWARLKNISENTLTLDLREGQSLNWEAGDRIVVTTTDYLPTHTEEAVVQSVAGNTVTLNKKLDYPHNTSLYSLSDLPQGIGPRMDPNLTIGNAVETRAAVALLTRSIIITSEGDEPDISPDGDHFPPNPGNYYGGHTIVRQGFTSYQVQGVEFWRLGQGGIIGRYPVHFHMARKTPQPIDAKYPAVTFLKDCTIDESMTRWITIHATQGLTIQRNVGYKSIGHGYYLEDATEINNKLYGNIGISVIAAVYSTTLNPREVPGILAAPDRVDPPDADFFPYRSDWNHPTTFWMMNGWNDFRYNAAIGVTSCGACYWLVPGAVSGPSVYEIWKGYASQGIDASSASADNTERAGLSPLQNFVGNSCSAAMSSFQTVGETFDCHGFTRYYEKFADDVLVPVPNMKAPEKNNFNSKAYYPQVTGLRVASRCVGADAPYSQVDCSNANMPSVSGKCGATGEAKDQCEATVLDHYTTSFNYAQTNFAAIWLRPWWYLVTDSAITDSQYGGLNFVTSGGYTRSDAPAGYWSVAYRSVFIGTSQAGDDELGTPANPYASNAGPFNPISGLKCENSGVQYCISRAAGVSVQLNNFPGQRMFSIYDGPAFQQNNAYLDVYPTLLKGCTPSGEKGGNCSDSGWMYGRVYGIPKSKIAVDANPCYLPNAAIGWKQPNGFYYPPAFHSLNLYFRNTNIRHFVVEPSFLPGTFQTDLKASYLRYCNFKDGFFTGFTDIDRQTVLNDGLSTLKLADGSWMGRGDGSLTGLTANENSPAMTMNRETISVNEDPFFNAPLETVECASDLHPSDDNGKEAPGSAKTSPYEYPTVGMIADCAIGGVPPNQCKINGKSYWGADCGSAACFGPRLFRQYLTNTEWGMTIKPTPSIHMMGQGNGQRSTLTLNHGHYYLDTTPDCKFETGGDCPPEETKTPAVSVFLGGHTYHVYFIYGRPDTQQTYDIYIGKNTMTDWRVTPERSVFNDNNFKFKETSNTGWLTVDDNQKDLGVVRVVVDLTKSDMAQEFSSELMQFCQPISYCALKSSGENQVCGCKPGTTCKDDAVCSWGPADPDCPETGCYGFAIKMPSNFEALDKPLPPPPAQPFTSNPYFESMNVTFGQVDQDKAGQQCYYNPPPMH